MYFMLNLFQGELSGHKNFSKQLWSRCFNFEKNYGFVVPTKQQKQHFLAQVGSNKGIFAWKTPKIGHFQCILC